MTTHNRVVAVALAVSTAVVLLGGCRPSTTVDRSQLEAQIAATLVPDHTDVVTNVSCPEIPRGIGVVSTCSALVGDQAVTVRVEQADQNGAVKLTTDATLLDLGTTESALATRLTSDIGVAVRVACQGARVQVLRREMVLSCSATDPKDRPYAVDLTFTDDQGAYTLTLR
jgi:hypothetical protein